MVDTIESFVQKLQTEGVKAGQQQAEQIRAEAENNVRQIVEKAKAEAQRIIADAQHAADKNANRVKMEMELASRDVLLKLRDVLNRVLAVVLAGPAKERLADDKFLSSMMHDIIMAYVQAGVDGGRTLTLNVSPEMKAKLVPWALGEIGHKAERAGLMIDLKGTLAGAGFEYKVAGATVEVTTESVVESLKALVSPDLKALIDKAAAKA